MPSPLVLLRHLPSPINLSRGGGGGGGSLSQSTSIPKKLQRVRDHAFDDIMEVEKKTRKALKLQDLILFNHPVQRLPWARLTRVPSPRSGMNPTMSAP